MVGDFIRNPIFQKIIYEIFNKNINKTLLADECIARGCSLYNCMINENFSTINDFNFTQFNESEKIMKIKFNNKNIKIINLFILLLNNLIDLNLLSIFLTINIFNFCIYIYKFNHIFLMITYKNEY